MDSPSAGYAHEISSLGSGPVPQSHLALLSHLGPPPVFPLPNALADASTHPVPTTSQEGPKEGLAGQRDVAKSYAHRYCFDCGVLFNEKEQQWVFKQAPYKRKVENWRKHVDGHEYEEGQKCIKCKKVWITGATPLTEENEDCKHEVEHVKQQFPARIAVVTYKRDGVTQTECESGVGCHEWYRKRMSEMYTDGNFVFRDWDYVEEMNAMLEGHPVIAKPFKEFMKQNYNDKGKHRPRLVFPDQVQMLKLRKRLRYEEFNRDKDIASFLQEVHDQGTATSIKTKRKQGSKQKRKSSEPHEPAPAPQSVPDPFILGDEMQMYGENSFTNFNAGLDGYPMEDWSFVPNR